MTVRIVADSSCDVPADLLARLGVSTVPLYIIFDDHAYRDGVDMAPGEILDRLGRGDFPRLSQPSPADFVRVFEAIGGAGPIISIHVAATLSGTHNAATLARTLLPHLDITAVDSQTGSMAAGWVVLEAAAASTSGLNRDGVLGTVESALGRTALFLLVPDLTHLHRAGRLGLARAWLGRSLSLTPIITLRGGVVAPQRLARGRRSGLRALVAAVTERFDPAQPLRAAAVHVAAEEEALAVLELLKQSFRLTETLVVHAGAAVTAALGPGAVGLCLLGPGPDADAAATYCSPRQRARVSS